MCMFFSTGYTHTCIKSATLACQSMVLHCACSKAELLLHWLGWSTCYVSEFATCIAVIKLIGLDFIGIDFFFPSFSWFLSGKSAVKWWDKWEYWHYGILVSNSRRSKLSGPFFFLLKLSLKLICKACFLKLEQRWVSLFKLKFWSIKMFLILDGISLIFVWQSPSWFSSKLMDEMQLREGRQTSSFSRTKKMFSLLLVPVSLFPWWWLLVDGPALKL